MAELRSVDPRILQPNPNNPRTTPVPPAMDEQLIASIKAVGIIQPPCVTPKDDKLMIAVGNRRVKAAIKADLPVIDVLVCDADEAAAAMRAVAENLIRASMSSVNCGARSSGSRPAVKMSRRSPMHLLCRRAPSAG
jgi:ParB/RepB/Spo0J family partition protein